MAESSANITAPAAAFSCSVSAMEPIQASIDAQRSCLLGRQCQACGRYFFPRALQYCRNPHCGQARLADVALARVGALWSYTNACIPPPAPFPGSVPFTPFAIAAVQLEREGLVLLGPVVAGVGIESLRIGMRMQLVIERFCQDGLSEELIWKWQPLARTE